MLPASTMLPNTDNVLRFPRSHHSLQIGASGQKLVSRDLPLENTNSLKKTIPLQSNEVSLAQDGTILANLSLWALRHIQMGAYRNGATGASESPLQKELTWLSSLLALKLLYSG